MGLDYIYPWQRLVIADTLEALGYFGEEREEEASSLSLVILPTGAGKSLCFMLPALMTKGITVILFPLLALMADQERRLRENGEEPVVLKGGQSRDKREAMWKKLAEGKSRFLLTNPEIAAKEDFLIRLEKLKPAHLVLDEVHTVPQWGESFREGLLRVGRLIERDIFKRVTAYTATASPDYERRIGKLVFMGRDYHVVRASPNRANIAYHVVYTPFALPALEELCLREIKPILVFCSTRSSAEDTARYLQRRLRVHTGKGDVKFYHAGLTREEKQNVQDWFQKTEEGILTATCAYGMGMDVHSLRTVIHRDVPYSMEAYVQEAGRGGRRGDPAKAIMLVDPIGIYDGGDPLWNSFVRTRDKCRRNMIMEALGADPVACGGCDHCTPEDPIPRTDRLGSTLEKVVGHQGKRFTRRDWSFFLKGYPLNGYWRFYKGFGLLKEWDREIIEDHLKRLGKLKKLPHWGNIRTVLRGLSRALQKKVKKKV